MFTKNTLPLSATFNSITSNPHIGGDERNFVGIRELGTNNPWSSTLRINPGRQYIIRLYVHNNSSRIAKNVRANFNLPITTAKIHGITGGIESSNSKPSRIWDGVTIWATEEFNIFCDPSSIQYYNNHFKECVPLSEYLFTKTGVLLGYETLDGNFPGGLQHEGYVTFVIKPQFTDNTPITDDLKMRSLGQTGVDSWQSTLDAQPGDLIEYQIHIKNTSDITLENVRIRKELPLHTAYVPDTILLFNTNHPNGIAIPGDITTTGVNIGGLLPDGDCYIRVRAKVTEAQLQ